MKTRYLLINLVLLAAMLLASCSSQARVGALRTESQSVEMGDAESVRVEVEFGAGDLELTGGADKLVEGDFTYNVARLKPELKYTDGKLVVRQPEIKGLPVLQNISDFRNKWSLRLNDGVPMDLSVNIGAGLSDLKLGGLSLTRLNVSLGAGTYMIDLSGDWARDLDVSIDAGAASLTVMLPRETGVRVDVGDGPHTVDVTGLVKDGDAYTNAAYGVADNTLQVNLEAGIGFIFLEVEEEAVGALTPTGQ